MAPEYELIATKYLELQSPVKTAQALAMTTDKVMDILRKPSVRKYLDTHYLETGYINKHTIQSTLNKMIDQKMQDAEESGIYTKKDLADLLEMAHDFRLAEEKLAIEKLKLETQLALATRKIDQTESLTHRKLEAADKRFHLKLEHDKKLREKETSAYTALLERLLVQVPNAERVYDSSEIEDV